MPSSPIQASTLSSPTPSNSKQKDKSTEHVHKTIAQFPNMFSNNNNAHTEKILEVFNKVKINLPLLDAIQQVPIYAKFLKDVCTKKRKTNVPKKVFLATNISELLSNQTLVKYKDPGCPTISCTIGQAEINQHFLI